MNDKQLKFEEQIKHVQSLGYEVTRKSQYQIEIIDKKGAKYDLWSSGKWCKRKSEYKVGFLNLLTELETSINKIIPVLFIYITNDDKLCPVTLQIGDDIHYYNKNTQELLKNLKDYIGKEIMIKYSDGISVLSIIEDCYKQDDGVWFLKHKKVEKVKNIEISGAHNV